ncbi:MAG: sigma-E processing peptidase SpoIIGA [Christensenellales bacterium]
MELYIEYVILDNVVMNYIILKFIDITLGVKISVLNKCLVCILGTIFSIFLPYLYFNKFLLFGYRFLVSIILVMCIKKFKKIKNFLGIYSLFMTYTFLMGGVCFGLINLLGIKYNSTNLIMFSFEFPMGVFILILLLIIKLMCKIIWFIKTKLKNSNFMYDITLIDGESCAKTTGFYDSGNNIIYDDKGVNIISINLFLKLYKNINLTDVMFKKNEISDLKKISYIDIAGIGKKDKYLSFEIDRIIVNGCNYNSPRLVVAMKNFDNYDCILHKQFVKGE